MFGSRKSGKTAAPGDVSADGGIIDHLESEDIKTAHHLPRSPRQAIEPEKLPQLPLDMNPRRNPFVVFFNGLISLIVFVIIVSGAAFYVAKQQFEAAGPLRQTRAVIVPRGESLTQIARRLEREGVISDSSLFFAGVYMSRASADLKAGEYLFREQISMRGVMDLLVEGKAILHRVTIPEGLTSEQIVARLNEEEVLSGTIDKVPAEGTILPDTYKVTRGTSAAEVLNRMVKAHDRALARIWERRDKDLPLKSPEELVVLASIVEKETGKADERPRVASVFINRLKRSMRLQSDPTIIYGLVGGKGSLGRPILQSELDRKTPYNTYQIDGLPPTPIANPGIAALEATANPSRTDDLYFVADGTGGHVFATSLGEHNDNVARWRKLSAEAAKRERERKAAEETAAKEEAPAPEPEAKSAEQASDGPPTPPRLNLDSLR